MLIDYQDADALRLLKLCKDIPDDTATQFGADWFLPGRLERLCRTGLAAHGITHSYHLTQEGASLLHILGPDPWPAYFRVAANSRAFRRRLAAARIMLTCYAAGLPVLNQDTAAACSVPAAYLSTTVVRAELGPLLGSTRFAGLLLNGPTVHILFPCDMGGLLCPDEESGMAQKLLLRHRYTQRMGVVFAGKGYETALAELTREPRRTASGNGKLTYQEAFHRYRNQAEVLLACNHTGVAQLKLLLTNDARAMLAHRYLAPTSQEDFDGTYQGIPAIVAVDGNIRRLLDLYTTIQEHGGEKLCVLCLSGQAQAIRQLAQWQQLRLTLLKVEESEAVAVCGCSVDLYAPSPEAVQKQDGRCIKI